MARKLDLMAVAPPEVTAVASLFLQVNVVEMGKPARMLAHHPYMVWG
jgi:hypothetical protein